MWDPNGEIKIILEVKIFLKMEAIANQILLDIKRQRKVKEGENNPKTIISEKPVEIEKAPEVKGPRLILHCNFWSETQFESFLFSSVLKLFL